MVFNFLTRLRFVSQSIRGGRGTNAAFLTSLGFALSNFIRMVSNLVLSHLLVPEAFGLMALANILVQAVQMFSELGVGPCLIQHARGEDQKFVNTAWTIQILRGPLITLTLLLLAYPLAIWYEEPRLFWVTALLGLVPLIQSANSTAIFTAGRRLELGRLTFLELFSQFAGAVGMCLVAWWWPSVGALIFGTILGAVVLLTGSHLFLGAFRNRLGWDRKHAQEIFRFGKWIAIGTAITFFAFQIDRVLLGKLGTLSELGIYHLAMSIAGLAPTTVGRLSYAVQFPMLAEAARKSPQELREKLIQTRRPLLYAGLLVSIGGVIAGPLFFTLLYRENYRDAGVIVQLLFVATWFSLLSRSVDRSLVAVGDTRSGALAMLVGFISTSTATILGYHFGGINGFCLGVGFGALSNHLALYPAMKRHGLVCVHDDIRFTSIAFTLVAVVYCTQNSEILRSIGTDFTVPTPMLGHWTALSAFIIAAACFGFSVYRSYMRRLKLE